MEISLKNKKTLVLASSEGIGLGIAKQLAISGADVIITSRREEVLSKVCKEIGAAGYLVSDLEKPNEGKRLIALANEKLGGLDILVTNTGGPPKGHFKDITDQQWLTGFQSLFLSATGSIRAALPLMEKNGWGRIVCITSTAAKEPISTLPVSSALRAGLHGLVKIISNDYAKFGITINAVMPGYTETERLAELGYSNSELTKKIPAGRLGTTTELGQLITYLCSNEAAFINGQAISIDGGMMPVV
jgi:3-oxoacyl-[acyl-carrier protein] reductase